MTTPVLDTPVKAVRPRENNASPRLLRALGVLSLIGGLLVGAGLAIDTVPLAFAGGALVALVAAYAMVVVPEWMILGFVVVRPLFDIGPTYGRGPNLNAAAGALLLAAIISWLFQHRDEVRRPAASVLAACAFAGAALLSAAGSYDPANSFDQALRVVSIVGLFVIAEQIGRLDPSYFTKIVIAIFASATIAGLIAVAQIVGFIDRPGADGLELDPQLIRPPGPYPAPTVLATHLIIACSLLFVAVPRMWAHPRWRLLVPHAVGFAVACLWVLSENKSRSATLSLVFLGAVFAVVRWKWVGAAAAAMLILAAGAVLEPSAARLDELGTGAAAGANADTFEWRVDYWADNLPRWFESPVTGIGLGRVEQLHMFRQPPHSTVVQTIVEMGAIGAIAYLAFAGLLARDLWRGIRRARGTPWADVFVLVALLCMSYAFMGLFENLITQVVTSGPMALLCGATLGAARSANVTLSAPVARSVQVT